MTPAPTWTATAPAGRPAGYRRATDRHRSAPGSATSARPVPTATGWSAPGRGAGPALSRRSGGPASPDPATPARRAPPPDRAGRPPTGRPDRPPLPDPRVPDPQAPDRPARPYRRPRRTAPARRCRVAVRRHRVAARRALRPEAVASGRSAAGAG